MKGNIEDKLINTKLFIVVAFLGMFFLITPIKVKALECSILKINGTAKSINNEISIGLYPGKCTTLIYPDNYKITIGLATLKKLLNTKKIHWVKDGFLAVIWIKSENNPIARTLNIYEDEEREFSLNNKKFKIKFKLLAVSPNITKARDGPGYCSFSATTGEVCMIKYNLYKDPNYGIYPYIIVKIKRIETSSTSTENEKTYQNTTKYNITKEFSVNVKLSKSEVNIGEYIDVKIKISSPSTIVRSYLEYGNKKYDLRCYGKLNCESHISLKVLPGKDTIKIKVCNFRDCKEIIKKIKLLNYIVLNKEKEIKLDLGKSVTIEYQGRKFQLILVAVHELKDTPYIKWARKGLSAVIYVGYTGETWTAHNNDEITRGSLKFKIIEIVPQKPIKYTRYDANGASPGCMGTYGNICLIEYSNGYVVLKVVPIKYEENTTDEEKEIIINERQEYNKSNEEENEDLPPIPPIESKFKFTIYKGWNIISNPTEKELTLDIILSKCRLKKYKGYYTWYYNSRTKKWEHPKVIPKDSGVYIYSDSNCVIELEGDTKQFNEKTLYKGWNLISVNNMSWSQIKGNCKLISKIWEWDPITKQWRKLSIYEKLNPWKAYWIKVANTCKLSIEESIPVPPIPH